MESPIRLSGDDWAAILPMKEFTIGKTIIVIEPLGLKDLALVAVKVRGIFLAVVESGIAIKDIETPAGLVALFQVSMDRAPELLEMACGLHRDDIARLPISKGLELITAIIEVNVDSQEDLIKNLKALGEKLGLIKKETTTKDQESPTSSSSSSPKATASKK